MSKETREKYWRKNIHLMIGLLILWFIVSFLFGIILVEPLNTIRIGGYKLGFWFAQQGSMYTFVGIVFFYAWRMHKLDQQYSDDDNNSTDKK